MNVLWRWTSVVVSRRSPIVWLRFSPSPLKLGPPKGLQKTMSGSVRSLENFGTRPGPGSRRPYRRGGSTCTDSAQNCERRAPFGTLPCHRRSSNWRRPFWNRCRKVWSSSKTVRHRRLGLGGGVPELRKPTVPTAPRRRPHAQPRTLAARDRAACDSIRAGGPVIWPRVTANSRLPTWTASPWRPQNRSPANNRRPETGPPNIPSRCEIRATALVYNEPTYESRLYSFAVHAPQLVLSLLKVHI